jgi:Coenzyme PQQ synthesis protein D (PqqD)
MPQDVKLESVCIPSEDIVAREIEGEVIIVPLVSGIGETDDELFTLNPTGQAIWKELDGRKTLGQVAAALTASFEAPLSDLEADVLGFASELVRRRILLAKE